jgi:hypothetical protein
MTEEKYILIVGGSAGSKIATNIFGLIYPYHKIFYCECYAKEIQNNILYKRTELYYAEAHFVCNALAEFV